MTHTGVQIGVAHQQFGHPGVVAALRVAFQRVGIVLFQLVVKPAPAEQRFTLFLRVFPIHLPKEKGAETGPEVESLPAVVTQHGGVPQEPVHPFAGTGVAADHPHHFHVKVLKQRKLQQKPPHRKVKAVVHSCLKVGKHFPVGARRQLRAKRLAVGHLPRRNCHTQRIAERFFQDAVDFAFRHGYFAGGKKVAYVLMVKKQVIRLQGGHQTRVLECRQVRRRHPAGEEHKPTCRIGTDQFTERLRGFLLLQKLKVVDQQNIPFVRQRLQRKIRCIGTQAKCAPFAQQGVCNNRFAKAAGCAEKKDAPALHNTVKFLLH